MKQLNLLTGQTKEEIAHLFLKKYEPKEGYAFGNSGGKDSTVVRKLLIDSGVRFVSYFENTGIDPPEIIWFLRKHHPETRIITPPRFKGHRSFFGMIREKGIPPYRKKRWC